jgi:hypothetical protein
LLKKAIVIFNMQNKSRLYLTLCLLRKIAERCKIRCKNRHPLSQFFFKKMEKIRQK